MVVGLSLAAGILVMNLWMRNKSDSTDSETATGKTKDSISSTSTSKVVSASPALNEDSKSEEVDLHGRPWRAKGVGKHARAEHWTSRPSTANAWGVDEANAAANEQTLVVPRDSETGVVLPITAATLPQWLTVVLVCCHCQFSTLHLLYSFNTLSFSICCNLSTIHSSLHPI